MKTSHEDVFRDQARQHAKWAIADLARAFNHCHNPGVAYRYDDKVQQRFLELGAELVSLVESGRIVPRMLTMAQADAEFQRHMAVLTTNPNAQETGPAA